MNSKDSSAPSVTFRVDKGLIASELLELYGKENKSKNPIVGCKDREKTFKNEIQRFFLEKIKRTQVKSGLGGFAKSALLVQSTEPANTGKNRK